MKFPIFVICLMCMVLVAEAEIAYKAAIVANGAGFKSFSSAIREAGKMNADILVLPPSKQDEIENYDEITKSISSSAKQVGMYVVSHQYEKSRCQNRDEVVRSSLVFDRQGNVVAVYRKPVHQTLNCTAPSEVPMFTTDFGVTFALMMEEDLVLQSAELAVKNYVVVDGLSSKIAALTGAQFSSSWAYVVNANLLTSSGIFAGKAGLKTTAGKIAVVNLDKDVKVQSASLKVPPSTPSSFPEDLQHYIVRPLDLETSAKGYTDAVCHGKFCCNFYVKTSPVEPLRETHFGLAVFSGALPYTNSHHIGAQTCSVVACAGLYKRSCTLGLNNSTDTVFEKIVISANFSKDSTQFPVALSTENQNIKFEPSNRPYTVTISIENGKSLLSFGIFGRDYSKDSEIYKGDDVNAENYYDYFFNEEVLEFFDYLWIRLRVLIFIVSIYFLEML